MAQPEVNKYLIRKMTRYYRYLSEQLSFGVKSISSIKLAELMDVSPSQVRQDFNRLTYGGQHGVGYDVEMLLRNIVKLLNFEKPKNIIIVGAGNLGQSLCNYDWIRKCGFVINAFFDINPRLEGAVICGIPVHPMEEIVDYIRENNIVAAILSIPTESTKKVAHMLYDCGIRLFLNFNPVFFDLGDDVYIENVHMDDNLMMLSYMSGRYGQNE